MQSVMEKLRELKALDDANRAIDEAFVAGVQSVTPLREFVAADLAVLLEAVRSANKELPECDPTRDKKRRLKSMADLVEMEIWRREEAQRGSVKPDSHNTV